MAIDALQHEKHWFTAPAAEGSVDQAGRTQGATQQPPLMLSWKWGLTTTRQEEGSAPITSRVHSCLAPAGD